MRCKLVEKTFTFTHCYKVRKTIGANFEECMLRYISKKFEKEKKNPTLRLPENSEKMIIEKYGIQVRI